MIDFTDGWSNHYKRVVAKDIDLVFIHNLRSKNFRLDNKIRNIGLMLYNIREFINHLLREV